MKKILNLILFAFIACVVPPGGMTQSLEANVDGTDEQRQCIQTLIRLGQTLDYLARGIPKGTLSHDVSNFENNSRWNHNNENKLTKNQFQRFCGNVTNAIGKTRQTLSFYDDIAKMLSQNLQDVQKLFTDLSNSSHKTESWDIRDPRIDGVLPRDYLELFKHCILFQPYHTFQPHPYSVQPFIDRWNQELSNMQYTPITNKTDIANVVTQWKYNLMRIDEFFGHFPSYDSAYTAPPATNCIEKHKYQNPIQTFLANYDMLLGLINTMLYTLPIAKQIMTKNCDQLEKAVQQSLRSL